MHPGLGRNLNLDPPEWQLSVLTTRLCNNPKLHCWFCNPHENQYTLVNWKMWHLDEWTCKKVNHFVSEKFGPLNQNALLLTSCSKSEKTYFLFFKFKVSTCFDALFFYWYENRRKIFCKSEHCVIFESNQKFRNQNQLLVWSHCLSRFILMSLISFLAITFLIEIR